MSGTSGNGNGNGQSHGHGNGHPSAGGIGDGNAAAHPQPRFPGTATITDGAGAVVWVEIHITQAACAYPITSSTTMGGGYSAADDLVRFADALTGNLLFSRPMSERVMKGYVSADYGGREGYGFETRVVNRVRILGHQGGAATDVCARLLRCAGCAQGGARDMCGKRPRAWKSLP